MLCDRAATLDGFDSSEWAAEAKFDGWRAIVHVNGGVKLLGGRNGSDYSGQVPYLEAALAAALPPDSCIDGELMSKTGWGGVQGAMTRGGCGDDSIYLVVFDVLRLAGHDTRALPWSDRRRLVERIPASDRIVISKTYPIIPELVRAAVDLGFEGVVLKRKSSRYINGRSPAWVKIKPQETAEAVVTGFKPGEGAFAGLIGAIEFRMLDGGATSRCSGFDMKLRAQITANPQDWLGQVIEIKHHGIGATGKPRHPQYLRRRDDRVSTQPSEIAPPRNFSNRGSTVTPNRMRNYGAMGDAKLLRCIDELAQGAGDAYERCVSKGGDPAADLAAARQAARLRNL